MSESAPAADAAIVSVRIHPAVGVARVGDSRREYFLGPERTGVPGRPPGGYKDSSGRLKRQAARFRLFGYDEHGRLVGEIGAREAHISWRVHVVNRKAAAMTIDGSRPRNPGIEGHLSASERDALIIDPGAKTIDGDAHDASVALDGGSVEWPQGSFTHVSLGELRVDARGALLVLGGRGVAAPFTGQDTLEHHADNDGWFDDTSDGPVFAEVRLRGSDRTLPVTSAWVVVAPPDYAPGIESLVTLHDVALQVAEDKGYVPSPLPLDQERDVDAIFRRSRELGWVSNVARRGHGHGKSGEPHVPLNADSVKRFLGRLRRPPGAPGYTRARAVGQASAYHMPPFSGDGGERVDDVPETWATVTRRQYARLLRFARGEACEAPEAPNAAQALDRAALAACVGGPFYPGYEVSDVCTEARTWRPGLRIDPASVVPGELTARLAVPWQADAWASRISWWPSHRPDDVITEDVFESQNEAWSGALAGGIRNAPVTESLEARVRWDRDIGTSAVHDMDRPRLEPCTCVSARGKDGMRRNPNGARDMVRYWSELGVVTAVQAASREIIHVERERAPYAGMPLRTLFHALATRNDIPACLPKARAYVDAVLAAARAAQARPGALSWMEIWAYFDYSPEPFAARMQDILDDYTDYADRNTEPDKGLYAQRDNVIEQLVQLAPFNLVDGAWLRHVNRTGAFSHMDRTLQKILHEEHGGTESGLHHAELYHDLLKSVDAGLPPVLSRSFAHSGRLLDSAFENPVFQLAISEFTEDYFPEIIGMTLYLEWAAPTMRPQIERMKHHGISHRFFKEHLDADNAEAGHGGQIKNAVERYLEETRTRAGDESVQQQWRRIWSGYVAFALTFTRHLEQIRLHLAEPPHIETKLHRLIDEMAERGEVMHQKAAIDRTPFNELFQRPAVLLDKLANSDYVNRKEPGKSELLRLISPGTSGMSSVFTAEQVALWHEWVHGLGTSGPVHTAPPAPATDVSEWHAAVVADLPPGSTAQAVDREICKRHFEPWLASTMLKVVFALSERQTDTLPVSHMTLCFKGEEALLSTCLAELARRQHALEYAHELLAAMASPDFVPDERLRDALRFIVPGYARVCALEVYEAWAETGRPLPPAARGKMPPLAPDDSRERLTRHPTGRVGGAVSVH